MNPVFVVSVAKIKQAGMHAIIKWLFSHASVRQPTIFATNTKKDLLICRILCWRTYELFFAILFPERGDITKNLKAKTSCRTCLRFQV